MAVVSSWPEARTQHKPPFSVHTTYEVVFTWVLINPRLKLYNQQRGKALSLTFFNVFCHRKATLNCDMPVYHSFLSVSCVFHVLKGQ